MDCIFSCWTQDTPPPPPLGNTLLTDPAISANEHKWNALTYEFIHIIAIAAFIALSIGVLTWVILFAAEYQAPALLAATFLFSTTYPICIHPYRIEAQSYWRQEAFEHQVGKNIEIIQAEYNRRKDQGQQYLLDLHHKIGASPLSEETNQKISTTTQKVCAYEALIPLYARSITYNEEAGKNLTRLRILILSPPRPTNQQKPEDLNYQELQKQRLTAPADEQSSITQKITQVLAEWRKLEENYLALRMKAAQVAAIASNPIQTGNPIGAINRSIDAATESLWLEYANGFPYLFTLNDGSDGLTRERLMTMHTKPLYSLTMTALHRLINQKELSLEERQIKLNDREISTAAFLATCSAEFQNDPGFPPLSDDNWKIIDQAVLNFVKKWTEETKNNNIETIFQALQNPLISRELLSIPTLKGIIETNASHAMRDFLTGLKNKL